MTTPGAAHGEPSRDGAVFPRRTLLKGMVAGSLAPLLGANLIGCSGSSASSGPGPDTEAVSDLVAARFEHGVASGDPLRDQLIIWTRVTPQAESNVQVEWEVARDRNFAAIEASGGGVTQSSVDYTVKVDVEGLAPGTDYFYRFRTGDAVSEVGHGRTLPSGAPASVSFAVVSCANYPAGYFHVYREVASQDVDAVLHLGDYIYEYAVDGYASDRAAEFGRESEPPTEIVALDDYRTRYAQYRSDPDLQAAHAAHSFIVVWDDHEVTNNTWRDGGQNHQPETEGDFDARKTAAIQAWCEWLPVRPPDADEEIICRRFEYGDLVNLMMLDTRVVGRDRQLDRDDFISDAGLDAGAASAAANDPGRSLLGRVQREWLKQQMSGSTHRWQVLGQQVMMARQAVPAATAELLGGIISGGSVNEGFAALEQVAAASAAPPDSPVPLNFDSWDGYGFERDDLLELAARQGLQVATLTGDTHMSWASQLTTAEGTVIGVEFAAPSVTSPGFERTLGVDGTTRLAAQLPTLIGDLVYAELAHRGYVLATFTPNEVTAEWRFVTAVDTSAYEVLNGVVLSAAADSLILG